MRLHWKSKVLSKSALHKKFQLSTANTEGVWAADISCVQQTLSVVSTFVLSRGRCGHLFCHVCVFTIKRWVDDSFGFVNNDESTFNSLQVRCLWFGDRHKQAELFILIEPTICCLNIYCHQIEKNKKKTSLHNVDII